jgi:hypothetical protein
MLRQRLFRFILRIGIGGSVALAGGGCVEQTMTLDSDPPGALVYMNDQEIGRTPLTRDFTWHGNYEVRVRKDGYDTLKTTTNVKAPWWQWVPFDLAAQLLPLRFTEHQHFTYALTPASTQPADPDQLITRAQELRDRLQSSRLRPPPAPTTQP